MKKLLLVFIQFLLAVSFVFSAKKTEEPVSKVVVLDWQDKDDDEPMPEWAVAVLDGSKGPVESELGLEGYHTWIFDSRGSDLAFIRNWTDVSDLAVNVSRQFCSKVQRVATQQMEIEEKGDKESVTTGAEIIQDLFTNMEISGLQQFGSFWIKQGYLKDGIKKPKGESDYDIVYIYLSVWGMSDELYQVQLNNMLKLGKRWIPPELGKAFEKTVDVLASDSMDSEIIVSDNIK